MDKCTREVRKQYWKNIITQCLQRPEGMTVKQWLEDNGICEQTYYHWLKRIRQYFQAYLPLLAYGCILLSLPYMPVHLCMYFRILLLLPNPAHTSCPGFPYPYICPLFWIVKENATNWK